MDPTMSCPTTASLTRFQRVTSLVLLAVGLRIYRSPRRCSRQSTETLLMKKSSEGRLPRICLTLEQSKARAYGGPRGQPTYVLVQAWQEVPTSFFDALIDTVRNRLLQLALELSAELGPSGEDTAAVPPESVDRIVNYFIYGGSNVIAGNVGEVAQAGTMTIVKGDLVALSAALESLGVDKGDVSGLQGAIAEDNAAAPEAKSIGAKTREWITTVAYKLGGTAGDAALGVAKAEVTTELTKLVSSYLGLS
jgi:hypothetical protein